MLLSCVQETLQAWLILQENDPKRTLKFTVDKRCQLNGLLNPIVYNIIDYLCVDRRSKTCKTAQEHCRTFFAFCKITEKHLDVYKKCLQAVKSASRNAYSFMY